MNPLKKMDDERSKRYWEFLDENSKIVAELPAVKKGEPVTRERDTESEGSEREAKERPLR
jgi:hypothetical protein